MKIALNKPLYKSFLINTGFVNSELSVDLALDLSKK